MIIVYNPPEKENAPKRPATVAKLDPSPKLNELKVSYRRRPSKNDFPQTERPILNEPDKCYDYLRQVWDPDTLELREEIVLICLDRGLAVIGWVRLHAGGISKCIIDLPLLFGVALKTASSAIIIAHNHPSGDLTPSQGDRDVTKRVAAAGEILGIRFLDHLIVSGNGFYSFYSLEAELFDASRVKNVMLG